jgi:hypothetical protein
MKWILLAQWRFYTPAALIGAWQFITGGLLPLVKECLLIWC